MSVLEFDSEHCVGERLGDCALEHNRIFFMLWQDMPFRLVSALGTGISCAAQDPAGTELPLVTGQTLSPDSRKASDAVAGQRSMLVAPETATNVPDGVK